MFGFSQGAATAFRWLNNRLQPVNYFVIYASLIPPDIQPVKWISDKVSRATFFVCGDSDQFITKSEKDEQNRLLSLNAEKFVGVDFTGGHLIDSSVLLDLNRRMDALTPFC